MEYKYFYTIPNLKYLEHLYNYILENGSDILPIDFHLNIEATLDVVYNQELTNEQKIVLDNIISGYTPPQQLVKIIKTETIVLSQNTLLPTNNYTVIGTYFYTKPTDDSFISSFKIVSSVDGNTNYKFKVNDSINDSILCESLTFNNNTLQIINITDISNLPNNDTLLEIQCVVSGNNKCNIKLVQINFSVLF
jgi:hypothetical protein